MTSEDTRDVLLKAASRVAAAGRRHTQSATTLTDDRPRAGAQTLSDGGRGSRQLAAARGVPPLPPGFGVTLAPAGGLDDAQVREHLAEMHRTIAELAASTELALRAGARAAGLEAEPAEPVPPVRVVVLASVAITLGAVAMAAFLMWAAIT